MQSFHNTTNLTDPELLECEAIAEKQDDLILQVFKRNSGAWYNPFYVALLVKRTFGKDYPITSIRRSITNLTKLKKLVKSDKALSKGQYGKRNHCWTINSGMS